jgi:hypothetical protein
MTTQPELFDLPPDTPLPRAKTLRELDREARPRWSRYRPVNRVVCDECVIVLHEAGGVGPPPRAARWRLSLGATSFFFCDNHTDQRRQAR